MELLGLLENIPYQQDTFFDLSQRKVLGIAESSAKTENGFVFVAIKGTQHDGHQYIQDAITRGATAIVGEDEVEQELSVPYLRVENSREVLGRLANNFYHNPSKSKVMIGVTGTNGKTTTSYLIKHILETNGISCSLIGTIQTIINGKSEKSINTTPSSLTINQLLAKSEDLVVILEASSHGLSQYRLEGIQFDVCIFLNLTHDHLDYHKSLEEYFQSKASLFHKLKNGGIAIINTDDYWGGKLFNQLQGKVDTFSVGNSDHNDYVIDWTNQLIKSKKNNGENEWEQHKIEFPMAGIHNMYNASMAFVAAEKLAVTKEQIIAAIENFPGVDGRFEVFKQDNGSTVVIDYAHTADAIFHCLQTAKSQGAKRIVHIFGFRGNRDETKRKEMLQISADLSDQYILTLDDLNNVKLKEMLETLEALQGKFGNDKGVIMPDRTLAIEYAMTNSQSGDWIIVTGKGHERYQQTFALPIASDRETVTFLQQQKKMID
ncbi:UDP-N-acetylmuramoyl-L-alanyl-D-glutamate--2,6-diaminopimelate ligase [Aquibacillus salsiterrae]|uniref:UDP-N-acetylmuramoyl-L-alanyl-D-glutamate--2, 6-diaminopimelate ligase n=1 Tax=Aquibacillus salsiterrae TaxID=2950439 RepID=A0A9X3WF29_9BACI|nr:UDP-N-acetylmuramoyl-L-alanyl-D-glutamate--2,6-diaminopimelate ligase [Aquibacillus salsiterrae]MDC3418640.1 UDP-N-acetylmuramoyl-L-alanyl-D-glutamate--2,6-diaminopimelate ligase [Aquibacillus salsiterrae]